MGDLVGLVLDGVSVTLFGGCVGEAVVGSIGLQNPAGALEGLAEGLFVASTGLLDGDVVG